MTILVTGSAGFIGFHLTKRLLELGNHVVGIDNLNSYYDPKLKNDRNKILKLLPNKNGSKYSFLEINLEDKESIDNCFRKYKPKIVFNLAAQAGVRYSIENPSAYIQSNIVGFGNILESCRYNSVENLIYASSSSVYGGNTSIPFSEHQGVDHPVSLYAASKRSNELMAHSYSHLYNLPTIGLRFFTVYGPWGRPDMALFLFTKSILRGESIKVFNHGEMKRDFTYIDDIIESLIRLVERPALSNKNFYTNKPDPATSWAPYKIFNIGNSQPTPLLNYIEAIESELMIEGTKEYLPMQLGDVQCTASDTSELEDWINFKPNTSIKDGISKFISWYKDYYKVEN